MSEPILEVRGLQTYFPGRAGFLGRRADKVKAVDGVSFSVRAGEVLGLVGESGCGKTTTGKTILKLIEPTGGSIHFRGEDITHYSPRRMLPLRRHMQIIFQDPYSSLNPRLTIGQTLAAPFEIHGLGDPSELPDRIGSLLRMVGLPADVARRYPHEFSGGQRQRIGVARALALRPQLIIGDEPVSALDVSIQAQIINLLQRLRAEMHLTYVFISHNLGVVSQIADRVAVMHRGRVVELAPRDALFFDARHPYTRMLLAAVPQSMPGGTPRVAEASPAAGWMSDDPILREVAPGHFVADHQTRRN